MPITKGVLKEHLTFFARDAVPVGSVVSAPIRKKMVPALVIAVTDVREEKLDLKAAGFALKRLGTAAPRQLFNDAFMRAVTQTAQYFATNEGPIIAQLTYKTLLTSPRLLSAPKVLARDPGALKGEVVVLQAGPMERFSTYRNLVRESFARNTSVVIIAPTLVEIRTLKQELERGIEAQVVTVSSDATERTLRAAWNAIASPTTPQLIIGTPSVLSMPLTNIHTIVVEREGARAYRTRTRPFIDTRLVAEFMAEHLGARLLLADFPVRVETRYRVEAHEAEDLARPQLRIGSTVHIEIVDTRRADKNGTKRAFSVLAPSTIAALASALDRGERAVVFAARKGLAPLTVCNDCGTPVTDPATGAPMVLYRTPTGNVFISHRSGALIPAHRTCTLCGSWNLVTLGIGVDRVVDEIKKQLPQSKPIVFTQETAPTDRAAQKLSEQLYGSRGTIVVGTERMLPYLTQPVTVAAVASIDSVLSSSAWRAHEHSLQILYYLATRADEQLIIETRRPDNEVIKNLAIGNPMDFYRIEIAERQLYSYPPFAVFVGLTWSGTESSNKKNHDAVVALLKDFDLVGPLEPEQIDKNKFTERAVVRVGRSAWPNPELSALLASLPPDISVSIDPDEIV